MSDEKVVDLSKFLGDPGDETDPMFEHDSPYEPKTLEFPADDEGGVIEVTIEEVLAGFAQGLDILRLGLIELFTRVEAIEGKVFPEDADLDADPEV